MGRFILSMMLLAVGCLAVRAADDGVAVAKKLAAVTVTVRATAPEAEPGKAADVTVFSGVSLGGGLVVTFSNAPESWRYRLTLSDGTQADGALRVKDLYSGLSVLEITSTELPNLAAADEMPDAGSTLYTAAAAGIDKPVISRGILGAVNRKVTGRELPPLLQCDLRTTETSPGAAVVDHEGRLLGIVAMNSLPGEGDGWTYAVPVRHVQRVHKAYTKGEVKTLRQQRPVLGLKLEGKAEGVVAVEEVTAGGPAEKAGIRKGDLVMAVQGQKVRSVYHVVGEVINHQPGDRMDFTIQQGDALKTVALTLGRGEALGKDQRPGGLVGRTNGKGVYEIVPVGADGKPAAARVPKDAVSLLQNEVNRLQLLIQNLLDGNQRLRDELNKVSTKNAALEQQVGELKQLPKK